MAPWTWDAQPSVPQTASTHPSNCHPVTEKTKFIYMIIPKTSYGIQSTTHREKIKLKGENLTSCRVDR